MSSFPDNNNTPISSPLRVSAHRSPRKTPQSHVRPKKSQRVPIIDGINGDIDGINGDIMHRNADLRQNGNVDGDDIINLPPNVEEIFEVSRVDENIDKDDNVDKDVNVSSPETRAAVDDDDLISALLALGEVVHESTNSESTISVEGRDRSSIETHPSLPPLPPMQGDGSDNNSNEKRSASVNNDASNVTVSVEVQHQGEVVYNASIQPNENVSAVRTLVKDIVGSEVALCLDDKRTHTNDTKSLSEIANDDGDVFLVAFVVDWEATRETRSMSPTLGQLIDLLTFAYNIRSHDVGVFCKVLTKVSAVIQEVIVGKKQDGNNNDIGEDENIAIIKLIEVLELIVEKRSGLNLLEQWVRDLNEMLALHVKNCMNESGTSNISINAHNNVEGKDCSVDEKKNGSKAKKPRVSAEDAAEDELYSCPCCDLMLLYPFPKVVIEVEGVSNNWQNTIVRPCKDDFLDTSNTGWKRHHKGSYCHPAKTNHITAWSPSPEVGEDKFLTENGLGQALAGTFIAAFIQSYLHPIDEVKTFFRRFTKNILLKQDKLNSESVQNVFFHEFNKNFTATTLKDKVGSGLNAAVTKKVPKEGVDSCALKAFLPKRSDIFVILKSDACNAIKYVMRALQGSPYPKEFDFDNGYDSDNVDSTEVGDKQQLVLVADRVTNVNSITNLLMNILFYQSNERILKVCKKEMQGSPLVDQIKVGAYAFEEQVKKKAKMMAELIHYHFVDVKKHVRTGMQKNVVD
eukprot:scaffold16920_cov106-Skeletonema_marinoi.AAC.2